MPYDPGAAAVSKAEIGAKSVGGHVIKGAGDFSKEFVQQLFGLKKGETPPTTEEVEKMDEKDTAASDAEYAATRQKIINMYEMHRQKRLKEARVEEHQQVAQKQAKDFEKLSTTRTLRHQRDVVAATGKASAETGRNFGTE